MNARDAFDEMMHRQASARHAREEAAIRAELVSRIRVAIKNVDDYDGASDLFTHMAEAAVDTFAAYYREGMSR